MTAAADTAEPVPTSDDDPATDASVDPDEGVDADAEVTVTHVVDRETNRWVGVGALAFLAGGLGVLLGGGVPSLLLAAAIGVAYAAFSRTARPPVVDLHVERTLGEATPDPDDSVEVTVTVRNDGPGLLSDLRIVDGVPRAVTVDEGTPRHGTALRPGHEVRFNYTVTARRGVHEFEPMTVYVRDPAGSIERELAIDVPTRLTCVPPLSATEPLSLRGLTSRYAGRVTTDTGGEGVEFHAVREYRHGDPVNRIDWNNRARTGALATLEFREERAARVILMIDAREEAYWAASPDDENALERSIEAANALFAALLDRGDQVGIVAISPIECWLPPGAGREHRTQAQLRLATAPAFSPQPPEDRFFRSLWRRRVGQRIPDNSQVIVLSSLCDEFVPKEVRRLDALGHTVTVVSPDVTAADTPGRRLVAIERDLRITWLRESGVRVVNWDPEDSLALALRRADARWIR